MHIEINLTDQVDFRTERCTSCREICTPHTERVINLFMACRLSMHSPRVVPTKQLHSMHVLRQLHLPLQALNWIVLSNAYISQLCSYSKRQRASQRCLFVQAIEKNARMHAFYNTPPFLFVREITCISYTIQLHLNCCLSNSTRKH